MEDIRNLQATLQAKRVVIAEKSQPLRDQRSALQEKEQALSREIEELTVKIREIEDPTLYNLDKQISSLAIVLGAKSLSNPE